MRVSIDIISVLNYPRAIDIDSHPISRAALRQQGRELAVLALIAQGALEVLAVNNENVRQRLNVLGGDMVLDGIATMGSTLLREVAKAFGQRLKEKPAAKMDAEAQIKAARQTRMRYDGVRQRAFSRMQGWGETQQQAQQAAATGASYNLREG